MYSTYIFVTFLSIFILTALVALGDLVGLIRLPDASSRKWLRTGLLAEVAAVILAMASILLVKRDSEVWTIYGKIGLDQVLENASPQQAILSIAPPTVEIDELGRFEASVVIRKKQDGSWDFPKIQMAVPGYASRTVHFDDIWMSMGDKNMPDFTKDEDKRIIVLKTPIILEAIQRPYMPEIPESGKVQMMMLESAPTLQGEEL